MNRVLALLVAAALAVLIVPAIALTAPTAPAGVSGIALDGKVGLSWKAVSGASSYKVYRGTSVGSITTQIGTSATTSYTDTTATNNTTYYYAVKATATIGGDSSSSSPTQVKPVAKSCSTGSALVQENCFPGTSAWRATATGAVSSNSDNIEGFTTEDSVNQGGSLDVKVNAADNAPYRIEIYRLGWYNGTYGRMVSTIPNLTGLRQDACAQGPGNTGLVDCSNWTTSATITTSTSWPSGTYMLRFVRTDTGNDNNALFVVRNDASTADVLYDVPTSTYQAYNNWGDKSLYDINSLGDPTVAGTPRAVKVSYNRPYANAQTYFPDPNWYGTHDVVSAGWLERNGYDVTYASSVDLHRGGTSLISSHKVFLSPTHDEYWSSEMRNAVTAARNAGTSLFWMGSNQVYWKSRFENDLNGTSNRTLVTYKTTQSGAADPVSPTGTWRDPAGANSPENGLVGQMYIGDNDSLSFKLGVNQAQGKNRIWRHTNLDSLTSGQTVNLGQKLVGWEWNDRVANGQEPAGTTTWTSSAVTGQLVQNNGRDYMPNAPANATGTVYRAASGAYVVSTGTNQWVMGLGNDPDGDGEPNAYIQQATTNILADMNARPTTPIASITVDPAGAPTVSAKTPSAGATGVPTTGTVTATFDRSLDPNTVTSSTVTLTTAGGASVPATVSYDDTTHKVTLTPSQALAGNAQYTAKLKGGSGGISGWGGDLAADVTWSFTTGAGLPPTVTSVTPADNATAVAIGSTVKVAFDRDMLASTINTTNITLTPQLGTAIPATVTYSASTDTATLTPSSALDPSRQYTLRVASDVKGADGTALAADKVTTFTTNVALTVSSKSPAPLATGVAPAVTVRATFNRAVDPTTITAANVTLKNPSNVSVAATVSYDSSTKTVSIQPNASLALSTQYTVKLAAAIKADDGATLGADVSWTFTTAASAPPAPTITSTTPASGATAIPTDTTVRAVFSRAMDPSSFTGQTMVLRDPNSTVVAATISYDSATNSATLTPAGLLSPGVTYTLQITTGVRAADGTQLAATASSTFKTADCPCTLLNTTTPALTGLDVQDGRPGSGATYEMGMKFTVDRTMRLTAIRYYKDAGETGSHVGRLWDASGTQLGTVNFAGETASGWQQAALSAPVTLSSGTTYTVSVGLNTRFVMTSGGLASSLANGPLHSVAGSNGVFGNSAGTFPSNSWNSSNYFVAPVVSNPTTQVAPQVTSRSPVDGATGVDAGTSVTATFANALDASSISSASFTLQTTSGGTSVPATVTYDGATKTATLTPSAALAAGTGYTARLTTGVRSDDGTPLASAVTWAFTTAAAVAPTVTSKSPAANATGVAVTAPVTATFSLAMDASTLTTSTVTLVGADANPVAATVSYDGPTKTVTLTPSAPLSNSQTYTATITTGAKSSGGLALGSAVSWSFTTAGCPCSAMSGLTPALTGLDVSDGRGSGTWTYEMGTKIQVSTDSQLTAIRFYKDAGETGTHTATLWSAGGTVLAQATFTSETASGWQQQALASPVALTAGTTYVVSVNMNTKFVMTGAGLASARTSGPLSTVVGSNGVFGTSAGTFPSNSYNNSNYFVDAVVQ